MSVVQSWLSAAVSTGRPARNLAILRRSGPGVCDGNRIDDRKSCDNVYCEFVVDQGADRGGTYPRPHIFVLHELLQAGLNLVPVAGTMNVRLSMVL